MIDTQALHKSIIRSALGAADVRVTTKLVAMKVLAEWIRLAKRRLNTGKREYIGALGIRKIKHGEWSVYLGKGPRGKERLPWMLEFGTSGAEINKGLQAAARKAGGYINVPMQHGAGSLGLAPHGRRAAASLAPKLDNAVKASRRMQTLVAQGQKGRHSRFSNLPAAAGSGHTTSITSALQRLVSGAQKRTSSATGKTHYRAINRYMTWRRFGENSHWDFKGFRARNLAQEVLGRMGSIVEGI